MDPSFGFYNLGFEFAFNSMVVSPSKFSSFFYHLCYQCPLTVFMCKYMKKIHKSKLSTTSEKGLHFSPDFCPPHPPPSCLFPSTTGDPILLLLFCPPTRDSATFIEGRGAPNPRTPHLENAATVVPHAFVLVWSSIRVLGGKSSPPPIFRPHKLILRLLCYVFF